MTGWRSGLVAGNPEVVERYRQLKTNLDSGMFEAVQHATAVALTDAREFPREMSAVYERRRDLLAEALARDRARGRPAAGDAVLLGASARRPRPRPRSRSSCSSRQAWSISPGPSFGPSGEGFVRLSLTVPDSRLDEAARRIESSLRSGIITA